VFPTVIGLVLSLAPAHAFLDDFEGDRLEDYWDFWTEQNGFMDYHVHDSLLHVTGMGPYENYGNSVFIDASLGERIGDFDLVARVGWEEGQDQSLYVRISDGYEYPGYFNIAQIYYSKRQGKEPVIGAQANGYDGAQLNAPTSGFHEFRLVRTGRTLRGYFNGTLFLTSPVESQFKANWIILGFRGPNSDAFAGLVRGLYQCYRNTRADSIVLGRPCCAYVSET